MAQIEIHEFSTGIQFQGTPGVNWVATGFTGGYMNATLDPIPVAVQKAIANLDFSAINPPVEPTIVGREVISNLETWSVVAIISQGYDNFGRTFAAYRYFLAKGAGNLGHISAWLMQQKNQTVLPLFDPFDGKIIGKPTLYDTDHTKSLKLSPKLQDYLNQDPPIVIPHDRPCTPIILNTLATEKANENGEPVSWAHQVAELEKPQSFQTIQAIDGVSQDQLQDRLNSTTCQTPQPLPPIPPVRRFSFQLQPFRIYLYILAGSLAALIGWNLAQFFLADLNLAQFKYFEQCPELVLFPFIGISLAIGMVLNEISISNPTRLKLNLRVAKVPVLIAIGVGLVAGLMASGLSFFLRQSDTSASTIRVVCWLIIGLSVGLAEGLAWQFYSQEASDRKRASQRLLTSIVGGGIASLVAAFLFEKIRNAGGMSEALGKWEDPLGFVLLGGLLGLIFSLASSPSYLAALRAGKGFEYRRDEDPNTIHPQLKTANLQFVTHPNNRRIEEGLSIQLPAVGTIRIGSNAEADICIPDLPDHLADIKIDSRDAQLFPNPQFYNSIEIQGDRLDNNNPYPLKHNYLLAFYTQDQSNANEPKYRFVYYNRFLDPQA